MQKKNNIIYGIHSVSEALDSGKDIDKVFILKGIRSKSIDQLMTLIRKKKISVSYVPLEKLEHLAHEGNHQGIAARISPVRFAGFDELLQKALSDPSRPALLLLLDGITDVRNFGAIIRTASCAGVHGIVIAQGNSAPLNEVAVKTSAGAAFEVPVAKVSHLKDAAFALIGAGIELVAATEKAPINVFDAELNKPLALIMGSEERGIQPSLLKLATTRVKLPVAGKVASLNVSVACGAVLYEIVRQRIKAS